MNGARVRAIVGKEWLELRRNKMILMAMVVLPLVMVGTLVASLVAMLHAAPPELANVFVPPPELAHLPVAEALAVVINDQNMIYLILTPMLLPIVIGAYSIIGEKDTRSLEPILATPITTSELLTGKALAAAAPAVAIGLAQYALALILVGALTTPALLEQALRPLWMVGIGVGMPLLALLCTLLSMIVSSRMSDVRAAQGVSGLIVLPVMGGGVAVLLEQLYLDVSVMLVICGGLVALNALALKLAVAAFRRETILTRLG